MNEWIIWLVGFVAFVWLFRRLRGGNPTEALQQLQQGARLIDVRSPGEFASGHLPNAINIPVHDLRRRLDVVGPKDKPVVLYCASGARSAMAASALKSAGYQSVFNLGAMSNWKPSASKSA